MRNRVLSLGSIAFCSAVMFTIIACQDMFKGMGEMMALQQKLAEEFNTQNIGIRVTNGTHLSVTFQNSRVADLPELEQESEALQVALFIRDHYQGYNDLSTISVAFIRQDRYGPVSVTKTQSVFSFKPSDLRSGAPRV